MSVIVVIKTGNLDSCNARLKQLGINVRDELDDEGNKRPIEQRYEICNTPILTDVNGDMFFCVMLTEEQADKLPKNDTPNFTMVYDSRELVDDGEGNMVPMEWPTVEVNTYDEEGNITGTMMQGVGHIGR
jgi:hypothetical protein